MGTEFQTLVDLVVLYPIFMLHLVWLDIKFQVEIFFPWNFEGIAQFFKNSNVAINSSVILILFLSL